MNNDKDIEHENKEPVSDDFLSEVEEKLEMKKLDMSLHHNVINEKRKSQPLATFRNYIETVGFVFLSNNFNYDSIQPINRRKMGHLAEQLFYKLFDSEHKKLNNEFLISIECQRAFTTYGLYDFINHISISEFLDNQNTYKQIAHRFLKILLEMEILILMKIDGHEGKETNFWYVADCTDEEIARHLRLYQSEKYRTVRNRPSKIPTPTPTILTCQLCNQTWTQRGKSKPQRCARCNRRNWDSEPCRTIYKEMSDQEVIAETIKRVCGYRINKAKRLAQRVLSNRNYNSKTNIELIELIEANEFDFDSWK